MTFTKYYDMLIPMKLIKNNSYQTIYGSLIYIGLSEDIIHKCGICGKERKHTQEFVKGDIDNPNEIHHFGTECVKKIMS